MYQGELFAYHHYLHTKDILDRNVSFIFQDIACKYRPWAERVDPSNASKVTFALNLMHGTGHDWTCQVEFTKFFAFCHYVVYEI